jgi:hypothetical protein
MRLHKGDLINFNLPYERLRFCTENFQEEYKRKNGVFEVYCGCDTERTVSVVSNINLSGYWNSTGDNEYITMFNELPKELFTI